MTIGRSDEAKNVPEFEGALDGSLSHAWPHRVPGKVVAAFIRLRGPVKREHLHPRGTLRDRTRPNRSPDDGPDKAVWWGMAIAS